MDQLTTTPIDSALSIQNFDHAQRIAIMLAKSSLIPQAYQGKVENCVIALEIANRTGSSPLVVMQNLHIIQGRPSWSSPYIIAMLNSCGKFKNQMRFRNSGTGDDYGYEAYNTDKKDNAELVGPRVTWKMVKEEGWLSKAGSKWKTMPELMFQYRAAAFFGRLHAPELMMGMQSAEEVIDVEARVVNEEPKEGRDIERVKKMLSVVSTLEDLKELEPFITDDILDLYTVAKDRINGTV